MRLPHQDSAAGQLFFHGRRFPRAASHSVTAEDSLVSHFAKLSPFAPRKGVLSRSERRHYRRFVAMGVRRSKIGLILLESREAFTRCSGNSQLGWRSLSSRSASRAWELGTRIVR